MKLQSLLTAVLTIWPLASASPTLYGRQAANASCTTITKSEIKSMGNNTLFTWWRPYSHFIAPAGWMNDPCGAMYDPTTDQYHLFYQWHPEHYNWGNISWGHAVSADLITWTDVGGWEGTDALAMGPTGYGNYNGLGIFSGTAQPVNLKGEVDGTLLAFYTSVSYLPTSWTLPYHKYTETQSIAISTDGGMTWDYLADSPVINCTKNTAPMHWDITGFRDPFVEPFPSLDEILKVDEPYYYAVFGSGIKGVGPRMPLWTAPASDLTDWTFLGALWEPEGNSSLGPVLSTRTYAYNFEVSGFFALPDSSGALHYYVNMGAEGGNLTYEPQSHVGLWNEGTVSRRSNGSAEFTPIAGGMADWGIGYALTSFNDTKNNRRVQYGWVQEDIVGDEGLFSCSQQGFQGSHTLPRELFVHEMSITDKDGSVAKSMNAVLTKSSNGSMIAQTLGVKPLDDVVAGLQGGSTANTYEGATYNGSKMLGPGSSYSLQLQATVLSASGAVGVIVAASPDMSEYTTITYQPTNDTLLVERAHSTMIKNQFQDYTVTGYFLPYTLASTGKTEPITMTVFVDGSLVEVYVNDRFALSTRIYPSMSCSTGYGVYVEPGSSATFDTVYAWENLLYVWPQRPMNSSSMLVYDTPKETNDYVWWAGNK